MNETILPPPAKAVDPTAEWLRLVARERRTFRDFCRSAGDDERVAAYQLWICAHREMMAAPAPNEAALGHKTRSFLTMADMQFGEGMTDLSALCADLWRLADLEIRPSTAEDWLDAFECFGGCWTIDREGVAFFIRIPGRTDHDVMSARRLEERLHADPALHKQVTTLILDGRE